LRYALRYFLNDQNDLFFVTNGLNMHRSCFYWCYDNHDNELAPPQCTRTPPSPKGVGYHYHRSPWTIISTVYWLS